MYGIRCSLILYRFARPFLKYYAYVGWMINFSIWQLLNSLLTQFLRRHKMHFHASYAPSSLKIEDPTIFVGFKHYATKTTEGNACVNFSIATRTQFERHSSQIPKFTHAFSNVTQAQTFGFFKGAIIRCIDCASTENMCFQSILHIADEFRFVGFSNKQFYSALRAVSKQYAFLIPLAKHFSMISK